MDHLSASQMNLYFQCSLKYKFQYLDKLPKPFKASGLVFGSAIHLAISWVHKNQIGRPRRASSKTVFHFHRRLVRPKSGK